MEDSLRPLRAAVERYISETQTTMEMLQGFVEVPLTYSPQRSKTSLSPNGDSATSTKHSKHTRPSKSPPTSRPSIG